LPAAYNDLDGVPCTAHEPLLTGVLRDEWGFTGIVMADMFAVDRLLRTTPSAALAGATALRAGVDMSMCDVAFTELEAAVETGLADESYVDRACRRVLAVKVRLGLLDPPTPLPAFPPPRRRPTSSPPAPCCSPTGGCCRWSGGRAGSR
jgi:beta-glucosidase